MPALVEDTLEAQREVPIVLVSVDNATREPLVDPQELARRLAAMARILWPGLHHGATTPTPQC